MPLLADKALRERQVTAGMMEQAIRNRANDFLALFLPVAPRNSVPGVPVGLDRRITQEYGHVLAHLPTLDLSSKEPFAILRH